MCLMQARGAASTPTALTSPPTDCVLPGNHPTGSKETHDYIHGQASQEVHTENTLTITQSEGGTNTASCEMDINVRIDKAKRTH